MDEMFNKMFVDGDSAVYQNNYGAGFTPCNLGHFVGCDFIARSYTDMNTGFIPDDFLDLIWDSVADTDELIMRLMDGGKEN